MLAWYLHEHAIEPVPLFLLIVSLGSLSSMSLDRTCATLMSNETWLYILSNPRQFVMCLSLIKSAQIAKQ
jgi:hypothetical protein